MFRIKEVKRQALSKLSGHWSTPVLLTLVVGLINLALLVPAIVTNFNYAFNSMPDRFDYLLEWSDSFSFPLMFDMYKQIFTLQFLQWIFEIIMFIINAAISIALARFYLAMSIDPDKTTFNTFLGGLTYWGKGILATLWMWLWLWLWSLLFAGILIALLSVWFVVLSVSAGGFGQAFLSDALFVEYTPVVVALVIFMVVWSIAYAVVLINRTIAYSQMLFVQAEYPTVSVSKTLKASIVMTKGYRGKLFLLELSFIGWGLLSVLTACIGLLWFTPYYRTTLAMAYRFLKEKAFEQGLFVTARHASVFSPPSGTPPESIDAPGSNS
jgi:uncharacterized membrane protein